MLHEPQPAGCLYPDLIITQPTFSQFCHLPAEVFLVLLTGKAIIMKRHVSHVINTPALHWKYLIILLYTQSTFIIQVVVDKHEGSVELSLIPVQQDNIISKTVVIPDAHLFFHEMIQL